MGYQYYMGKKSFTIYREVLIIMTVIFAFMTAACINKITVRQDHPVAYAATFTADVLLVIGWIWSAVKAWRLFRINGENITAVPARHCGIFFVLLFCFFTRIVQFSDTPRWDAAQYYTMLRNACQNFDFSVQSFFQNFSMASHPTLGYAAVTAIGEFLFPEKYWGVLIVWLIVTLIAAFCLYRILEKLLPTASPFYHTAAACAVMCTPLVLGTFSYYQPDAGTVCFFVFVLYSYLYKRNLLMFFSMILLLCTKEIGIVILGGFYAGALLGHMCYRDKKKTFWHRLGSFLREPMGICGIFAALILIVYFLNFLRNGGTIWQIAGSDQEGFSTFSFQPDFIWFKCKQFFVLNFNWLIWGANLILFIYGRIRRIAKKPPYGKLLRKDIVLSIFMTALFQMIFYCSYITYALPRYHVLIDYCGTFLFVILVGRNLPKGNVRYAVTAITGMLLFAEAYTTIDPLSLKVFKNQDTGNGRIIQAGYSNDNLQGDFSVYNHQINYLRKAYEHILRDAGYHEDMDVLVWSVVYNYAINSGYYWDTQAKTMSMTSSENTISIRVLEQEMIEKDGEKLRKEAVFILAPQFIIDEEHAENFLNKYYEIRYKGYVEIPFGGKLTFYVCDLTDLEMLLDSP